MADAGPDQRVQVGEEVTLTGRAVGAEAPRFEWRLVSPPLSLEAQAEGATLRFTPTDPGLYVWSLVVEAGGRFSRPDYVTVEARRCADADGDGYESSACGGDDCDDSAAAVHPGAPEACTGGVDEDCDGRVDCEDADCVGVDGCA
ncbi:MAG: hypothetical protein D6729_05475, partial [Deltaproteobacteria bacterium]